jgi:hypothetical protein
MLELSEQGLLSQEITNHGVINQHNFIYIIVSEASLGFDGIYGFCTKFFVANMHCEYNFTSMPS